MQCTFKINYSFGYILKNRVTGEYRYFHPSNGRFRQLDIPQLIRSAENLRDFLRGISDEEMFHHASRPDSQWVVVEVTNVIFHLYKMTSHPIGCGDELPNHIVQNRGVRALQKDPFTGRLYRDNLCFFRCLALHQEHNLSKVSEKLTKFLFQKYCNHFDICPSNFKGVFLEELDYLENLLQINIFIYELQSVESSDIQNAVLIKRSRKLFSENVCLNLCKNHFSFIVDFSLYSRLYECGKCGKLWPRKWDLERHEKTCDQNVKRKYPGKAFRCSKTVFEDLDDLGIITRNDLRFYPYRATFDYECLFSKTDLPPPTEKMSFSAVHVPCSVSVCSNLEGFEAPVCFVSEGNALEMVEKKVAYLETIAKAAYGLLRPKYRFIFDQLDQSQGKWGEKLKERLESFLQQLVVVGFNSGKYDINLAKTELISLLRPKITFVIKRQNDYMCISTKLLRFLDLRNYLAPNTSYSGLLKAYSVPKNKGFFPYSFLDSLDKLNFQALPDHKHFFSSLKNSNITKEEYEQCKKVWQENNMRTLKDFLIYYNNLDTKSLLSAIQKSFDFYKAKGIDMFKSAISVPGLTLSYLFSLLPSDIYFKLIDQSNHDLHYLMKSNLVGGPSIVFHRFHKVDETYIREGETLHPKLCKSLFGFDANALYLWAISQGMPCGHFVRYPLETNFRPKIAQRFGYLAFEWLEWVAHKRGVKICHQFNGGEKRVGPRSLFVDGLSEDNVIYEFQGCVHHGCIRCSANKNHLGQLREKNHFGKDLKALREATDAKIKHLRDVGFRVVEIWECRWNDMRKSPEISAFLKTLKLCKPRYGLNSEKILKGIKDGSLFGMLLCDIETPSYLKPLFAELCPILKNAEVSRDDIGPLMKDYAEKLDLFANLGKC